MDMFKSMPETFFSMVVQISLLPGSVCCSYVDAIMLLLCRVVAVPQ